MMPFLWVYDGLSVFNRVGLIQNYKILKWNRRYNDASTFELKIYFTPEMYDLIKPHRVLYRSDLDEGMIVLNVNVHTAEDGARTMLVLGQGLTWLLDNKAGAYTGTGNLSNLTRNIINENIISPSVADRRVNNFIFGNTTLNPNPTVTIDIKSRMSVFGIIRDKAKEHNIGFNVKYSPSNSRFIFNMFNTVVADRVVFSQRYTNVAEQEVFNLWADYRNIAVVGDTYVGSGAGALRQEFAVSPVQDESATETGNRALRTRQTVQSVDVRIDQYNYQYAYRTDWDLGTTVTFRDDALNIDIKQTIIEVQEFYEDGVQKLNILFGDYLPTQRR